MKTGPDFAVMLRYWIVRMTLLIVGALLIAGSWFLAWTQAHPVAVYYFPPLWTGYILFVNGLCEIVFRDSVIRRMGWHFLLLFAVSIPLWWFFEYINTIVHNWRYIVPNEWSHTTQIIIKTISFSTVVPAVYSNSFLFYALLHNRLPTWNARLPIRDGLLFVIGFLSFGLLYLFPDIFFPLVWIAPLFVLEAFNSRLGFRSLSHELREGRWSLLLAFALGALLTGVFWEMWNFYAFPKWVYTIPLFDSVKIFEMPLLGYGGYIPFGLFVFSFTAAVLGLLQRFGIRTPTPRF